MVLAMRLGLKSSEENVCKDLTRHGEKCDWSIAVALRPGSLTFVQRDHDSILPLGRNHCRFPHLAKQLVQDLADRLDGTFQKFSRYIV